VFRKYQTYSHVTRTTSILSSEEIFSEEKLRFYCPYCEHTGGSYRSDIKEKTFTSLNHNPIHTVASITAVRRFFDIVIDRHIVKELFSGFLYLQTNTLISTLILCKWEIDSVATILRTRHPRNWISNPGKV